MKRLLTFLTLLTVFIGVGWAETTVWYEDWSSGTAGDSPSAVSNANATYSAGESGTKLYAKSSFTDPELLIAKSGGTFTATITLNGASGDLTLEYDCNRNLTLSSTTTGVTITNVSSASNHYVKTVSVPSGTATLVIEFKNSQSNNARLSNIHLYYSTSEPAATPTFSVAPGLVASGTTVTISSTTTGATIYYTTDGTTPDETSQEYTGAITINEPIIIKAIAVATGYDNSSVAKAHYAVDVTQSGSHITTFVGGTDVGESNSNSSPDAMAKDDVSVSSTDAAFAPDGANEYRLYKNSTTTFSVPSGSMITKIEFTNSTQNPLAAGMAETVGLITSETGGIWYGNAQSVEFIASLAQVRCSEIKVYYTAPVADGYYLVGDFSGSSWPALDAYKFTSNGNGIYVLDTTLPDMSGDDYIHFKIAKVENGSTIMYGSNWGGGYPVYKGHNTDIPMSSSDQEIYYMPDNYQAIFTLDINNMKFSVDKPQLFIMGTFNSYAEPGVEMTRETNGSWTLTKQLDAGAEFRLFDGWHVHHGGNGYWIYQDEHESFGEIKPSDLGLELDINNDNQSIFHMVEAGNYILTVNSGLTKFVADLAPESYAINCTATPEGTGTVTADKATAFAGETVTLTVTPANSNYQVVSVTLNGEEITPVNDVYSFSMPAGIANVVATFAKIQYTITKAETNCTIDITEGVTVTEGVITAGAGDDVSFTVTPRSDKYEITGVTVTWTENGGGTVTLTGNYSFKMVAHPVTITAICERISVGGNQFTLVKSQTDIIKGGEYVILNESGDEAMSKGSNANYETVSTQFSLENEVVTLSDNSNVSIIKLAEGGTTGTFTMQDGSVYVGKPTSRTLPTSSTAEDWTITYNTGGNISFKCNNYYIRNNSSHFRCYTNETTGEGVKMYKRMAATAAVEIDPATGEVIGSQVVSVGSDTDGALVQYKVEKQNGSNWDVVTNWTDWATYTETNGPVEFTIIGNVGDIYQVTARAKEAGQEVEPGEEELYDEKTVQYTFIAPNAPTITPASCAISSETQSVTIASDYANATIEYSTDGGTTWNNYSGPFNVVVEGVGQSVTVQARVTVNNVTSEVASATYTRGVQPVVFSPASGTYYDDQTCQMFSTSKGARIYYTTDGTEPIMNQGTTQLYTGEYPMPATDTYEFKARAYIGTTASEVTTANYNIRPRSEGTGYNNNYLLFSVAELNAIHPTQNDQGYYQTDYSYTMVNPVQVIYMSSYQSDNQHPEFCLVRDNTGYGMIYFAKNSSVHTVANGYTIYNMGDWIPGNYNGKISYAVSSNDGLLDDHPEMGTSVRNSRQIYNWPASSNLGNETVLPEYLDIPTILTSVTGSETDYWGHYVHLRKNTIVLTEQDEDGKWSGMITDENGEKINYYDKFYLQYGGDFANWTTENNLFTGHPNRTFDVYGFVAKHIPSNPDYQIAPFAFEWIDKPICDHATGDYTSEQTVTLDSPEDKTATIWYKTSDMDDFHVYTEPFVVNSTTTIEWYATKQSQYGDELESKKGTITMTFIELPVPVISPESQVNPIANDSYVDAAIAFDANASVPEGTVIYYTTDGSDPKTSENIYVAGNTELHFTTTTTVRAIAKLGDVYSAEAEAKTYTFVKSNGIIYDLVTNVNQLTSNGVYVIVSKNYSEALSTTQNEANRGAAGVMFVENTDKARVYGNDDVAIFTLTSLTHGEDTGTERHFLMQTTNSSENGYLYVGSETNNTLLTEAEEDAMGNDVAVVTIDADGRAHIHFNYAGGDNRYLQYWNRERYFTTYKTEDADRAVYIYYKNATPLAVIEKEGSTVDGQNDYTIADELVVVWANADEGKLWCKDQGNVSIAKTEIKDGQVDYMKEVGQQHGEWDQSNWVVLQFPKPTMPENDPIKTLLNNAVGKFIAPATVSGKYVDANNYTIEIAQADEYTLELTAGADTTKNVYCTANFLPGNLNINDGTGAAGIFHGENVNYFFMNPKIQEICSITFAEYDGNNVFVVPDNDAQISGAFTVDWSYNAEGEQTPKTGSAYRFVAAVQRTPSSTYLKTLDREPSDQIIVYPLDFVTDDSELPTGIENINAGSGNGEVKSVKYVNVAGIVSDVPFQGVNIVVTEYTDGSRTTTKMLKK